MKRLTLMFFIQIFLSAAVSQEAMTTTKSSVGQQTIMDEGEGGGGWDGMGWEWSGGSVVIRRQTW
jgi:hypothetical protein